MSQTLFVYAIWATIILTPLVLALGTFFGLSLGSARPFWLVLGYWLLIFFFPNASYGLDIENIHALSNIYVRGTGQFILSLVNILLIGCALLCSVSRKFRTVARIPHDLTPFFAGFWLFFAFNLLYFLNDDYTWRQVLSDKGLINVLNMMIAFFVVTAMFRDGQDGRTFLNVVLAAAVLRGLFGIGRFLFLGGDPANAYANYEKMDVRIVFFDINDVALATAGVLIAAWRLMEIRHRQGLWLQKLAWLTLIGLQTFVVLFSYRRSGWIGFGIVALVFAWLFDAGTRMRLLLLYAGAAIPALVTVGLRRGSANFYQEHASFLERLAPDIFNKGFGGSTAPRWLEWSAAWDAISSSPLIGLGIVGSYRGEGIPELAFHRGDFTWLHSGLLHIALKSGLVGTVLLLGMWVSIGLFTWRHWRGASSNARLMMFLGVSLMLFYLPTWVIGTPVIEYRTMQLMGLAMALPYVAVALGRARPKATTPQPV